MTTLVSESIAAASQPALRCSLMRSWPTCPSP